MGVSHGKGKLDIRPIYLRNEERTRAHLFVAMLSYKLELALRTAWKNINNARIC